MTVRNNWPTFKTLPYPVYFRYDEFAAKTAWVPHRHDWGQLNYVANGVMQLEIEGARFVSPPQYAVWIPPKAAHASFNARAVIYRSVYIDASLATALPSHAATLRISGLLRAILSDFAERGVACPKTDADRRLAHVLVDQLALAPAEPRFLPQARSAALIRVLEGLQNEPGDNRTLRAWASTVSMTERTLARHCRSELGVTLGQWRERMRFFRAIEGLEAGRTVKSIALDLGYATPSVFIEMFTRQSGLTPEQFRRRTILGEVGAAPADRA
ncbi:helix-turn-helix transcriptional regulator [Pandoraea nosoerga]|uniref:AraC family transcriptional regulator n=1 Tax=Pandoraea nosoerga TaxID=2508296 RepID=UPI001981C863|nr:helix-turn-helix transcriptional regulator [Pandoraea nosoerga]MBN4667651.1 helix-turn-helix transcriptional regulator [Pandoraea nosoerga]MBN4674269.1 helix-turn-helix transcriptional regulator [Pandoraea nosoerga]MBN4679538.1 helix-turn-helix transcriptional regulator [Pandoraea nosoerga]MBN4743373.1 helix-turn-helix transcriptional regulator [Pandoraea nosoerga]